MDTSRLPTLRLAARKAIELKGCVATSQIGRGRPENAFLGLSGPYEGDCAVRTAKHGWFAFPWNTDHWGTLRDSKFVLVANYDDDDAPASVAVRFFQADRLLDAFDAARQARLKRGLKVSDNTGMWVALHEYPSLPDNDNFEALADWVVHIPLPLDPARVLAAPAALSNPPPGLSIAEAKLRLAAHYGVEPQAIEIVIRG